MVISSGSFYYYFTDLDWMKDAKKEWEKLTGIGKVIREVEYISDPTKKTIETAYFIGSVDNVTNFATAARHLWVCIGVWMLSLEMMEISRGTGGSRELGDI